MDAFERNLEHAQSELGIEPPSFVPVVYKQELEASGVVGFLPTLLILGESVGDAVGEVVEDEVGRLGRVKIVLRSLVVALLGGTIIGTGFYYHYTIYSGTIVTTAFGLAF